MIDLETSLNLIYALHAMVASAAASINPVPLLYASLAATYGSASLAASSNDHNTLCRCYVISSLLHVLIGACHHLHM